MIVHVTNGRLPGNGRTESWKITFATLVTSKALLFSHVRLRRFMACMMQHPESMRAGPCLSLMRPRYDARLPTRQSGCSEMPRRYRQRECSMMPRTDLSGLHEGS